MGSFTSSMTNLQPNLPYYVRAYATNSVGTGYGDIVEFTTSPALPELTTDTVIYISQTMAQSGGTVTVFGGDEVIELGVCWSTYPTPTVADQRIFSPGLQISFSRILTDLTPGTTYYVRAYLTNSVGTGYGNTISFTTLNYAGTVTDNDGNVYPTIIIGNQEWMAKNFQGTHYRNGDAIPNVVDNTAWQALTTGAYCEYDNNETNVVTYGRLYNWYAVKDSCNIAPAGWHVPSDDEWKQLEIYLGMDPEVADQQGYRWTNGNEGGMLKEIGTSHWFYPNTGATNESCFSGLPGGQRRFDGDFDDIDHHAFFWTFTDFGYWDDENLISTYPHTRELSSLYSGIFREYDFKVAGLSVRCVKD
jgi:uncharacterized protein (TIGR02145 family)